MLKIMIAASVFTIAAFAQGNFTCGGTCVGTSNNQFYNNACAGASVNGKQACQNYSGLGCVWYEKVTIPGKCVGTSNNQFYNQTCEGASVNGQKACQNYSGLGCVWSPPYCQ
jgi:hypothetical protein